MSEHAVLMLKDPTKGPALDSRRPKFAAQLHPGQPCDPDVPGALKALVLSNVKEMNNDAYVRRHDFVREGGLKLLHSSRADIHVNLVLEVRVMLSW